MLFHITQTQLKQLEERTREAKMIWEASLKRLPAKDRYILGNRINEANKRALQSRKM